MIMQANRGILTLLATAVVASSGLTVPAQDQNTPEAKARKAMIGKMAPELDVNQWIHTDGKDLSLKSLRGKVVVLDFFTFW
jgi:cytochrome oxidase Cu insertion factor (SCO1/SenC/PrrC family)